MDNERKMIISYIGKRCRHFRTQCGYSIQEVASYLNISERTLGAYERGEREMSTDTAIKLAHLYKVSFTELTNYRNLFKELNITLPTPPEHKR